MMPKCNRWGYEDEAVFDWRADLYRVMLRAHLPGLPIRSFYIFVWIFALFMGLNIHGDQYFNCVFLLMATLLQNLRDSIAP